MNMGVEVPSWIYIAVKRLKPVQRMSVSQWAEEHRILPEGNAIPGAWRNHVTPYLVGIMDAFSEESIEEIIFVKPTQVGGTSAMENMLGSLISQDPAPTMVVYPSDDLAERVVTSKLEPMIQTCKPLAKKYRVNQSKKLALRFTDMMVYLTGANSPADLASTNVRYLFMDEVDKFPGASKKEADPVSLARERTKTYVSNRKIFMASTPTLKTGHIWRAKEQADMEHHYFVPCSHCGEYIELKFAQIRWPSKEEVLEDRERAAQAVYVCQSCGCVITDQNKGEMLRRGRWQAVRQRTKSPKTVAFWLNTLYSPFTCFSDIAWEFMKSKEDPELLHNFRNSWLAEPWEDTKMRTSADLVLERQTEFLEWELPEWTKLLTGGIDVQETCLYWTIRAWGEGMTSQNVAHGQVRSMSDVERVMNTEFTMPNGEKRMVNLALMDSGDQTDAVYEFCARNTDWVLPCKGTGTMESHYQFSTINKAGSQAVGMTLVRVDGGKYKDLIAARMRKPNGIGSWMVHKGCDLNYAEQVTAEHKVSERVGGKDVARWVVKTSHADNHFLDCEVYAAAAADVLGVRSFLAQGNDIYAEKQHQTTGEAAHRIPEEDWLNGQGDWI